MEPSPNPQTAVNSRRGRTVERSEKPSQTVDRLDGQAVDRLEDTPFPYLPYRRSAQAQHQVVVEVVEVAVEAEASTEVMEAAAPLQSVDISVGTSPLNSTATENSRVSS